MKKPILLMLSVVVASCGYQSESDTFFQKITDALESKPKIKLSEILDFHFDEVCIFQVTDSSNVTAADLLKNDIQKKGLQTNMPVSGKNLIWSFRANEKVIRNYSHKNGYFDIGNKHIGVTNKSGEVSFQFCGNDQTALSITDANILVSN